MESSSAASTPSVSDTGTNYELRIQSNQLDGAMLLEGRKMVNDLSRDVADRICQASDSLVYNIFPDEAFGFSINEKFAQNFNGVFLTSGGTIDKKNFLGPEKKVASFLNKIITTLASFFKAAKLNHMKPLRHFSALHANLPIDGAVHRKPDIVLVRLVDDVYARTGKLEWKDVQALVEHTTSPEVPARMAGTVTDKNYLMFCAQPEKDFILNLCITGLGIYVAVSDHAGQVDTDLMPFDRASSVLLFLRMVAGFAFLPDKWLGVDDTIIRRVHGQTSSAPTLFEVLEAPFSSEFKDPKITLTYPAPLHVGKLLAITKEKAAQDECSEFDTIAVGDKTYKVLSVLFQSPAFIGRATKVFLVRLDDNRQGVLKDSFINIDRRSEESVLSGLCIPFGPDIISHCTLGDTSTFRTTFLKPAALTETRQKRRIVTYPAGVHISDFSSLWELMVVFLDVLVGVSCLVIISLRLL
jgi:Fungal protein kinase